jgi:hypothetical protein
MAARRHGSLYYLGGGCSGLGSAGPRRGGIGLQTGAGQFTFSKGKSWILSPDFTIFRVVPSWALSEFAPYLKGH